MGFHESHQLHHRTFPVSRLARLQGRVERRETPTR